MIPAARAQQPEEGKLFTPLFNTDYQLMECTKGEYLSVDSNNYVRRWAPTLAQDQVWQFERSSSANRVRLKSGKGAQYLTVAGNGDIKVAALGNDSENSRSFEIYEIPDALALAYLPSFYRTQTAMTLGQPKPYKFVRIKEFTRNERVSIGSTGTSVRWSRVNENSQVYILWRFSPPKQGYGKDMKYTKVANPSDPKFPYIWNPDSQGKATGSFTRTMYSPLDGHPLMTYTSSLPARQSDGCSLTEYLKDPATLEHAKIFLDACLAHDMNYGAPWKEAGWNSAGQGLSDLILRKDMETTVNGSDMNEPRRVFARTTAETWYTALQLHYGKKPYESGQDSNKSGGYKFTDIQKGGLLSIKNDSTFLMGVDVTYTDALGRQITHSDRKGTGQTTLIPLSMGAKDITVTCYAVAGKVVYKQTYNNPVTEARVVSGLTANPSWKMTTL